MTVAERVVLTCSVGGDPPPRVIWMKNGRQVQLSERIRQLDNGSLVIIDSTVSVDKELNLDGFMCYLDHLMDINMAINITFGYKHGDNH